MAKLYWRVKKDGKWTWKPLKVSSKFEQTLIDKWAGEYQEESR